MSRVVRLVRPARVDKSLVARLTSKNSPPVRSSRLRFRAVWSPSRLIIGGTFGPRTAQLTSSSVRLSMSATVISPAGLCRAARMPSRRPWSGISTTWAAARGTNTESTNASTERNRAGFGSAPLIIPAIGGRLSVWSSLIHGKRSSRWRRSSTSATWNPGRVFPRSFPFAVATITCVAEADPRAPTR